MRSSWMLPVLIAASVVLTGCADDPPPAPTPVTVSFDDGWGQVFLVNLDGSGLRQVTPTVANDTSDDQYGNFAALSPDGTQLAYTRAGRFIDVVDLESGESRTVREGGHQPAFSPDGSRVAFAVDGYLVEAPVAGGEARVLLRDQFWNQDPAYSPDGSTLVFASNRGGNNGSEVYSMPAGGGPITALTNTYAVSPTFTPDGSRILYSRATTLAGELVVDVSTANRAELASMNPDGSDQKRVTPRSLTAQGPSVGGGR